LWGGFFKTGAMNSKIVAGPRRSRATIMEEVARALRDADASTNIESAIARTGISMREIADTFGSGRRLLLAMVADLSDAMSAPLSVDSMKSGVRERLLEFGRGVAEIYATSHLRSLYRIAITESIRHTGLGRDFYEAGPGRLTQRLADFLGVAQAGGALAPVDPDLLASHFLSLLRANVDMVEFFPHDLATDARARDAYVRNAVDVFCDGIDGRQHHVESA
jgi:hypothetical protein